MTDYQYQRGDIIRNIFAGENDPNRFLVFMGKSTYRQGAHTREVYNCIAYDGRKVQLFREPCGIIKVGHMNEFDAFVAALEELASRRD